MKLTNRAFAAVLIAGATVTGIMAMGAGPATAATNGLVNTQVGKPYVGDPQGHSAWTNCDAARRSKNLSTYQNENGAGDQYFYCAAGSGGTVNLWWRHYA